MENKTEGLEPQNPPEGEVQPKKVELTEEEYADLKHKAEVSSQNFERLKKLEAEKKDLEELAKNNIKDDPSDEVFSDEGKALKNQISSLEGKITSIEEERNLERLYNQYPLLREKAGEFIEYRKAEHPKAKIESVAKLFLAENGLLEPTRKGLEKPSGGTRIPGASGTMTSQEAETLRTTNYKKYREMVKAGTLKIE